MITEEVKGEYTRKYPREVPACISVRSMAEADRSCMDELENLTSGIGEGERSSFTLALKLSSEGRKVVVLTDDRRAASRFSKVSKEEEIKKKYPGSGNIILAGTRELMEKISKIKQTRNTPYH